MTAFGVLVGAARLQFQKRTSEQRIEEALALDGVRTFVVHNAAEMRFAEQSHPVQGLLFDRPHEPLGARVAVGSHERPLDR